MEIRARSLSLLARARGLAGGNFFGDSGFADFDPGTMQERQHLPVFTDAFCGVGKRLEDIVGGEKTLELRLFQQYGHLFSVSPFTLHALLSSKGR